MITQTNLFSSVREKMLLRFEHCGLHICSATDGSIAFGAAPRPGVNQRLRFTQPLRNSLPSKSSLGFACILDVCYSELEMLIASALGEDSDRPKRISLILRLCRLLPNDRCYHGVYIVHDQASAERMLDDYNTHLEPIRVRLCDISAFIDEKPPVSVGEWAWKIRRAAYLSLYGDRAAALQYFDSVEHEARSIVFGSEPLESDRTFQDLESATLASRQLAADEAKRVVAALQRRMRQAN